MEFPDFSQTDSSEQFDEDCETINIISRGPGARSAFREEVT
jgi:hypothetical protein